MKKSEGADQDAPATNANSTILSLAALAEVVDNLVGVLASLQERVRLLEREQRERGDPHKVYQVDRAVFERHLAARRRESFFQVPPTVRDA
jgi:hypothetical protein